MSESPLVIWVKDEQFRYRFVSKAFSELFEVDPLAVLETDDYAFMQTHVADELRRNDTQVQTTRTPLRTTEDVPGADGVRRRWLVHKFPIEQADGEVWVGGSAVDVTEWLFAEESLLDSEEHYRRLFEASPYSIQRIDSEGRLQSMNPAGLQMFGKTSLDEVAGNSWLELTAPVDPETGAAAIDKALGGEQSEFTFQSKTSQWFKSTLVPILDNQSQVNSLLGITEDISARKKADDQLRASEERHRLVAKATRDPIWEIDLTTGRVSWNEQYELKLGVRPADTRESWEWWTSRIHTDDRCRVETSLDETLADPNSEYWSENYRFHNHLGEVLHIEDRAFISRSPDGKPRRIVGTMRDQTPLVKAMVDREKLLVEAREAQRLESLGVLAGGIAHDFNNLLTAMLANISLLELGGTLDHEIVGELETAVEKASGICQQMLAYSGKGRFETRPLCLATLVSDMTKLLEVSVGKNVRIEFDLDFTAKPVIGDESQLSQLVMNLFINAAESIEHGNGSVTVRVSEMACEDTCRNEGYQVAPKEPADTYVCLCIKDDGVGMPEETIPKAFDPFFTTKFTGRGMGLAAVKGIIQGHNAGMSVRSAPTQGTNFCIWIPAANDEVSPTRALEKTEQAASQSPQRQVLVVDDEDQVRRAISKMLQHHGYLTTMAVDGIDAIDQYRAAPDQYQLILLDLTMPRLNGAEAFLRIKQEWPNAKIIIMSGYDEAELTSRFSSELPDGFLKKPFTLSSLLRSVGNLLSEPV